MGNSKTTPKWKGEKYQATLHEHGNNGTGCWAYGNTMDEARKKLIQAYDETKWHKSASSPSGFLYVLGADGRVLRSIGYIDVDKNSRIFKYKSHTSRDYKIIKRDGKIGMSMISYYKKKNKMLGL